MKVIILWTDSGEVEYVESQNIAITPDGEDASTVFIWTGDDWLKVSVGTAVSKLHGRLLVAARENRPFELSGRRT